jgi:hypothetical protein
VHAVDCTNGVVKEEVGGNAFEVLGKGGVRTRLFDVTVIENRRRDGVQNGVEGPATDGEYEICEKGVCSPRYRFPAPLEPLGDLAIREVCYDRVQEDGDLLFRTHESGLFDEVEILELANELKKSFFVKAELFVESMLV